MQMFGPCDLCFVLPTCDELLAYLDIAPSCSLKLSFACSARTLLLRGAGPSLSLSRQSPHRALSIICINENSSGRFRSSPGVGSRFPPRFSHFGTYASRAAPAAGLRGVRSPSQDKGRHRTAPSQRSGLAYLQNT